MPSTTGPSSATPRRGRLGLLRERDFRLLWLGEGTSTLGSAISGIALPLVAVVVLHAGPLAMGLLAAVNWLPVLVFGLPAGAWVDRSRRRRVMIATNAAGLALMLSVPVAGWLGWLSVSYLVTVALLMGTVAVFDSPAFQAFLPSIVAKEDLGEANAKLSASNQVASMSGSSVAGLIAGALGAVTGMLFDAVSYLVALACLILIRQPEDNPRPAGRATSFRQDIADGVRFMAHDPYMRIIALCASLENLLLCGAQALLVVFLVNVAHVYYGSVGLLMIADSLGGLAGALLARRLARRIGTARMLLVVAIGTAPFGLLIPLTTSGWGIIFFVLGLGVPAAGMVACGIVTATFRQSYCPPDMQGRVSTTAMVTVYGSMPAGALIGGALGAGIGIRTTLWIMLGALAAAKFLRFIGPIKTSRDLPAGPPAPAASGPA
ncbi:MAG TPA: MFS transporter [Trebonia sp.]|nr:MFS transporter [Trebonia sp.]